MNVRRFARHLRDETPFGKAVALPFKAARALGFELPESVYRHLPFHGIVRVDLEGGGRIRMHSSGGILENGLYWRGLDGYEPESLKPWCELAESARVVIDVGANTGLFSFLAGAVCGQASIHAFEPLARICRRLEANCKLNPSLNVLVHSCAVSDVNGEATFHDPGSEFPSSASLDGEFLSSRDSSSSISGSAQRIVVPVRTLDSFDEFSGENVDLIKIDSEGVEAKVLSGARRLIARSRPAILMEYLEQRDDVRGAVEELMRAGYRLFHLSNVGPVEVHSALPSSRSWNVLLTHSERSLS